MIFKVETFFKLLYTYNEILCFKNNNIETIIEISIWPYTHNYLNLALTNGLIGSRNTNDILCEFYTETDIELLSLILYLHIENLHGN